MKALILVKAIGAFLLERPWIALLGVIVGQAIAVHVVTGQRDALRVWQDEVTQATRDAAKRPKLAVKGVAQQVRYLGAGIDRVRDAMNAARADALAAKQSAKAADDARRKEFDNALHTSLAEALRHGDDYARANGVWGDAGRAAGADLGNDDRADLPGAASAAGLVDRPGSGPALVSITREAFDTCTAIKVRLDNGHAWAVGEKP